MLESGELNISEITRRSGLSHTSAAHHLEFLANAGLISEKRFNRIRIFRVEHGSPQVEALNRFFLDWRSLLESPIQQPFG